MITNGMNLKAIYMYKKMDRYVSSCLNEDVQCDEMCCVVYPVTQLF